MGAPKAVGKRHPTNCRGSLCSDEEWLLGGGALSLVMKVGDTISTSEGNKVVSQISLPGGTSDDRKFESRCMDTSGRLLIHVTFPDGSTSLLLGN